MNIPLIFTFSQLTVLLTTYCSKLTGNTAGSRRFSHMNTDVSSQRRRISESPIAHQTGIRFLRGMRSFVNFEMLQTNERSLADIAAVRTTFASVALYMALHHVLQDVLLVAYRAYVDVYAFIVSHQ